MGSRRKARQKWRRWERWMEYCNKLGDYAVATQGSERAWRRFASIELNHGYRLFDETRKWIMQAPSFTCPICNRTSYHPMDIQEGYCASCHQWTGDVKSSAALEEGLGLTTHRKSSKSPTSWKELPTDEQ